MSRVALTIRLTVLGKIKASLISSSNEKAFRVKVKSLLLEKHMIHPKAVDLWHFGWLTEKYPDDELMLFMGHGFSPEMAASDIAERVRPYSDARRQSDLVKALLIEVHDITTGGGIIDDHFLHSTFERPSYCWDLVEEMNRYVIGGSFDARMAVAEIATELKSISDSYRLSIDEMFDKADEDADRLEAERAAEREANKVRAAIMNEFEKTLRDKRSAKNDE
jgi:hypothetical protein